MLPDQSMRAVPEARPTNGEWTVKKILDWTTDHLGKHGSESARLDAEILLAHARGCRRIELYTRYAEVLTESERATMRDLVRRRANAEPVAYLVGFKEFYSLPFKVTPAVLIPRPETEMLVLETVEFAKERNGATLRMLDLCTGSGCIAVAAARNHRGFQVVATDVSTAALAVAAENAERNGVSERVTFLEGDLFEALPAGSRFDVIASNPPYVTTEEMGTLAKDIRAHEPALALEAGPDGFDCLRRIAEEAPGFLNPGGLLLVEMDPKQTSIFADWLRPRFADVSVLKDLGGEARVVRGVWGN